MRGTARLSFSSRTTSPKKSTYGREYTTGSLSYTFLKISTHSGNSSWRSTSHKACWYPKNVFEVDVILRLYSSPLIGYCSSSRRTVPSPRKLSSVDDLGLREILSWFFSLAKW